MNTTRGTLLGTSVRVADGWWSRLRGLLGAPTLEAGEGLVLIPCKAVHMYGMKQSLDVVFVGSDGKVGRDVPGTRPGSALEGSPGVALGVRAAALDDRRKRHGARRHCTDGARLSGSAEPVSHTR